MNISSQVGRCSKCGIHYIISKGMCKKLQKDCCYHCSEERFKAAALVFARIIQRMIKE